VSHPGKTAAVGKYFFNRYSAVAIAAQFVLCAVIWILAFIVSPSGDRLFGLMFYFYLPPIYCVSVVLNLHGESGMFAGAIYGMLFGFVLYGLMIGFAISYVRQRHLIHSDKN